MRWVLSAVILCILLGVLAYGAQDTAVVQIQVRIGEDEPQDVVYEYCEALINGSDTTTRD